VDNAVGSIGSADESVVAAPGSHILRVELQYKRAEMYYVLYVQYVPTVAYVL